MQEEIIEIGYAKINLHLDVTGMLNDGYHAISTVMQTISLHDKITISEIEKSTDAPRFSISCNIKEIPCDERNLAFRAALLFCKKTGINMSAHIDIEKNIPVAAGMAGGSADGAAVLRGLNRAAGYPLTTEELCSLASHLGSDIPFCVVGGTKFADGRGDILQDIPPMPDCFIVVACEGEGVSTPWGYKLLDTTYNGFENNTYTPKDTAPLLDAMSSGSIKSVAKNLYNIFEAPVLAHRPIAASVKDALLSSGALGAMMSGSGPSVFGIFDSEATASSAAETLAKKGYKPYICRPI